MIICSGYKYIFFSSSEKSISKLVKSSFFWFACKYGEFLHLWSCWKTRSMVCNNNMFTVEELSNSQDCFF